MDLGEYHHCLNVQNIEKSIHFYQKLGFQIVETYPDEKWAVLQHNNMVLALYQGHIKENLINFRGGDIEQIVTQAIEQGLEFTSPASKEADGSWSAEIHDPDGNSIYLNTFPDEREQYRRTGKLVEPTK